MQVKLTNNLGENIAKCRGAARVTQQELADEIGVTPMTIVNYESNASSPYLKHIVSIAEYFDVSIDELVGRLQAQ